MPEQKKLYNQMLMRKQQTQEISKALSLHNNETQSYQFGALDDGLDSPDR